MIEALKLLVNVNVVKFLNFKGSHHVSGHQGSVPASGRQSLHQASNHQTSVQASIHQTPIHHTGDQIPMHVAIDLQDVIKSRRPTSPESARKLLCRRTASVTARSNGEEATGARVEYSNHVEGTTVCDKFKRLCLGTKSR